MRQEDCRVQSNLDYSLSLNSTHPCRQKRTDCGWRLENLVILCWSHSCHQIVCEFLSEFVTHFAPLFYCFPVSGFNFFFLKQGQESSGAQGGLNLLKLRLVLTFDLPISAFCVAGIKGVCHRAQFRSSMTLSSLDSFGGPATQLPKESHTEAYS